MKLLHLYYDLMNLYGEYANMAVLASRLKGQGLEITVDRKTLGDAFDCSQYDFIYLGAGMESSQRRPSRIFSPPRRACLRHRQVRCFCSPATPSSFWAVPSRMQAEGNILPSAFQNLPFRKPMPASPAT